MIDALKWVLLEFKDLLRLMIALNISRDQEDSILVNVLGNRLTQLPILNLHITLHYKTLSIYDWALVVVVVGGGGSKIKIFDLKCGSQNLYISLIIKGFNPHIFPVIL